jgi:hypothetical protein
MEGQAPADLELTRTVVDAALCIVLTVERASQAVGSAI